MEIGSTSWTKHVYSEKNKGTQNRRRTEVHRGIGSPVRMLPVEKTAEAVMQQQKRQEYLPFSRFGVSEASAVIVSAAVSAAAAKEQQDDPDAVTAVAASVVAEEAAVSAAAAQQ